MTKIKYHNVGPSFYQWEITHGTAVITGTVEKQPYSAGWKAIVTHQDGEKVTATPAGGKVAGFGGTRKVATERAIHNQVIGEKGRWIQTMNH